MSTMTKATQQNRNKKPVNLTLSKETIRRGNELKKSLCRPSFSNLVEALIQEASTKSSGQKLAA